MSEDEKEKPQDLEFRFWINRWGQECIACLLKNKEADRYFYININESNMVIDLFVEHVKQNREILYDEFYEVDVDRWKEICIDTLFHYEKEKNDE